MTDVFEDWHCCYIPVTSFLYTKERLPKYIFQSISTLFLLWLITHFLDKYQGREMMVRAPRLLIYLRWSCEPITTVENTVLKETKSKYHIFSCKIAAALLLPLIMLLCINEAGRWYDVYPSRIWSLSNYISLSKKADIHNQICFDIFLTTLFCLK